MKKLLVIFSILFLTFGCKAPVNEFFYGGKGIKQNREILSTVNTEIIKIESRIEKLQQESQKLLVEAGKANQVTAEKYLEIVSDNEQKINIEKENLQNLFDSKNNLINKSIESDKGIYSGNMNPRKIRAAAEAFAILSFTENNANDGSSLKGIFINKSYYTINVKVSLGNSWMTEFNLSRKDGTQEINLPSYGDYRITLTKGTGAGSASTVLIKKCMPGITYMHDNSAYDLMVTNLR